MTTKMTSRTSSSLPALAYSSLPSTASSAASLSPKGGPGLYFRDPEQERAGLSPTDQEIHRIWDWMGERGVWCGENAATDPVFGGSYKHMLQTHGGAVRSLEQETRGLSPVSRGRQEWAGGPDGTSQPTRRICARTRGSARMARIATSARRMRMWWNASKNSTARRPIWQSFLPPSSCGAPLWQRRNLPRAREERRLPLNRRHYYVLHAPRAPSRPSRSAWMTQVIQSAFYVTHYGIAVPRGKSLLGRFMTAKSVAWASSLPHRLQ